MVPLLFRATGHGFVPPLTGVEIVAKEKAMSYFSLMAVQQVSSSCAGVCLRFLVGWHPYAAADTCQNKQAMSRCDLVASSWLITPNGGAGVCGLRPTLNRRAASKADTNINGVHKFLYLGHIAHLLLSVCM